MSVPQHLVIEMVREKCGELAERYDGYRQDMIGYLAEVLALERTRPHNVVQQVEGQLEAFAELYLRRTQGNSR